MSKLCSKFFLISCKKYSEYFSRDLDGDILTKKEKRNMNIHYFFCTFCRRYAKQIKLIDTSACNCYKKQEEDCSEKLPQERKDQIKKIIKDS